MQKSANITTNCNRAASQWAGIKAALSSAKNCVILTGAGVSAESGIPTFRGEGGLWRKYSAPALASPSAFKSNPSLVWEFYHHRREVARTKHPNLVNKRSYHILNTIF